MWRARHAGANTIARIVIPSRVLVRRRAGCCEKKREHSAAHDFEHYGAREIDSMCRALCECQPGFTRREELSVQMCAAQDGLPKIVFRRSAAPPKFREDFETHSCPADGEKGDA